MCVAGSEDEKECADERIREKAEEWAGKTKWMSQVNGQMEVERGKLVWELLARPCLEHAASVWSTGGNVASKMLEAVQERVHLLHYHFHQPTVTMHHQASPSIKHLFSPPSFPLASSTLGLLALLYSCHRPACSK